MALGEYWLPQPIVGHWTPTGFPGLNDATLGKVLKGVAVGGAVVGGGYLLGRGLAVLFGGGACRKPRRRRQS